MDLSSEELLRRRETLKQFENYIVGATNTLSNFVEKLGWTLDKTPNKDALVKCPINSEHRMLPYKLDAHCQTCILKRNGYDSTHSLYPSYNVSTSLVPSIKIDKVAQMNILKTAFEESNFTLSIKPELREVSQSIERYVCDFTPDERRVLYDSAVKSTKLSHHGISNDLTGLDLFNKTNEKPKTELEVLEEQRDLKRRRAAYRGKKVHTDKKSYVEVLREVVEGLTNNLSHQENKSVGIESSSSTTETLLNNRIIYKYEGNRNFNGNPYTRWLDIEAEESKLLKYYKNKSDRSYLESDSGIQYSRDKYEKKKSRRTRSKSREKSCSSELKFIRSKRSNSKPKFKDIKSKSTNTQSKSKETMSKKSSSRSVSKERKHKRAKVSKTRSKSSENISSIEDNHKRSKRSKTRSKSVELCSRKKAKHSKSPINYNNSTLSDEKDTTIKLKLNSGLKKKKKHKKKKKYSKSSKKYYKSKNNRDNEVYDHVDDTTSTDDDKLV